MKILRMLPLLFIVAGCASDGVDTEKDSFRPILIMASGEKLCGRHGEGLVAADGWIAAADAVSGSVRMGGGRNTQSPNPVPRGVSLTKDATHSVPQKVLYCSKCERLAGDTGGDDEEFAVPAGFMAPPRTGRWK